MSVAFEEKVSFCLEEVLTYGVSTGKYGGYSIPLRVPEDARERILKVADDNGAKQKMYGDGSTLYLRCDQLSEKQKSELLSQGKMILWVEFSIDGIRETNGVKRLVFSVSRLRKIRKALKPAPLD